MDARVDSTATWGSLIVCRLCRARDSRSSGLSGDPQLQEAYLSGDPYVAVGEMAGLIRPGMSEGERRQLRKHMEIADPGSTVRHESVDLPAAFWGLVWTGSAGMAIL